MREPDEGAGRARGPRRNLVDETVEGTFPASDAPSWGPLHIGAPGEHPEPHDDAARADEPPAPRGDR